MKGKQPRLYVKVLNKNISKKEVKGRRRSKYRLRSSQ